MKIKSLKIINQWPTSELPTKEEPLITLLPTKSERSEPQVVDLLFSTLEREPRVFSSPDQPMPESLVLRKLAILRTELLAK